MIRFLFSTLIASSTLPALANVTACKTKLQSADPEAAESERVEPIDLDTLIAQLEQNGALQAPAAKVASPEPEPVKVEKNKTEDMISQPEKDRDPSTLTVNELLKDLQLSPHRTRLALAEILKTNELNHNLQMKEEVAELFQGLVNNDLSDRQKRHLKEYKAVIENILQKSNAVTRFEILIKHSDEISAPQTIADLYVAKPVQTERQPEAKGFWKSLFGAEQKKDEEKVMRIPYENSIQYSRALAERSSEERVKILRQQANTLGFLSHGEVYQILMTIPADHQMEIYNLLKNNLIGRIDFYPVSVLKSAADIHQVAFLDVHPIIPEIILADLRETGRGLDLLEIYQLLKTLNFKSSEISSAFLGHSLSLERLKGILESQGQQMPFDDVLAFTRIFIHSSPDIETIKSGQALLKTIFPDPDFVASIDHFFSVEMSQTQFRMQQMIADRNIVNLKPKQRYEALSLMVDELQYLTPIEALVLLQLVPEKPFYLAEGVEAMAKLTDKDIDFFIDFRNAIRGYSEFHNERDKKWTASDLVYLHVSKNLDLAHKIIAKIKGRATEEQRVQVGELLTNLISQSKLHEVAEGEMNPLKTNMRPPRERAVSAGALKQYLYKRAANI